MGADANAGVGQYSDLPGDIYYKFVDDPTRPAPFNKSIKFWNKYRKATTIPPLKDSPAKGDNPTGYTRLTWLKGLYNATTTGPADFILRSWRGYKDDTGAQPVRYILPLHSSTVSSSLGTLKNDGYGY